MVIEIDGSVLEGGGQILRIAVGLSALLREPIGVTNIRAGRSTPGLRPQHLTGLELVRNLCGGKLEGAVVGSTAIQFHPGQLEGGNFLADTMTAGSVCLLCQVALPCLIFSKKPSLLRLRGGTNADMAPQVDWYIQVFQRMMQKLGINFHCEILRRGYYPKGGGELELSVSPGGKLSPIQLLERGRPLRIFGRSWVAGVLPMKMAEEAAGEARQLLKVSAAGVELDIRVEKEPAAGAVGNGNGMCIFCETSTGCILGGDALGKRGKSGAQVGREAAEMLLRNLSHGGSVDDYLQDQLMVFMALADGTSRLRSGSVSLHTQTAIHVIKLLTQAKFNIYEDNGSTMIECDGIGFSRK